MKVFKDFKDLKLTHPSGDTLFMRPLNFFKGGADDCTCPSRKILDNPEAEPKE
jgi:hypothetical protein